MQHLSKQPCSTSQKPRAASLSPEAVSFGVEERQRSRGTLQEHRCRAMLPARPTIGQRTICCPAHCNRSLPLQQSLPKVTSTATATAKGSFHHNSHCNKSLPLQQPPPKLVSNNCCNRFLPLKPLQQVPSTTTTTATGRFLCNSHCNRFPPLQQLPPQNCCFRFPPLQQPLQQVASTATATATGRFHRNRLLPGTHTEAPPGYGAGTEALHSLMSPSQSSLRVAGAAWQPFTSNSELCVLQVLPGSHSHPSVGSLRVTGAAWQPFTSL